MTYGTRVKLSLDYIRMETGARYDARWTDRQEWRGTVVTRWQRKDGCERIKWDHRPTFIETYHRSFLVMLQGAEVADDTIQQIEAAQ